MGDPKNAASQIIECLIIDGNGFGGNGGRKVKIKIMNKRPFASGL
jgi:hypothetical protein